MGRNKAIAFVKNVKIIPASDIWPFEGFENTFVMKAEVIVDKVGRNLTEAQEIRSSPIVAIDIQKGTIETRNTIYKIVSEQHEEVTKLLVPKEQT